MTQSFNLELVIQEHQRVTLACQEYVWQEQERAQRNRKALVLVAKS